ncbi:hypothetical protein METHB2_80077 [Candidatus Methylobacter favarea]|uniref:Uncharacterized protein n=1 Tax=Candidatus Methylobacter favarea TaxID=2707345 RepID=A0A8S0WLP6_9GAMM|nr:hypothetical protein METHB2_80077 [Candidatus Methylobacter favarea]
MGHLFHNPSGTVLFLLDEFVLIVEGTNFSNQLMHLLRKTSSSRDWALGSVF